MTRVQRALIVVVGILALLLAVYIVAGIGVAIVSAVVGAVLAAFIGSSRGWWSSDGPRSGTFGGDGGYGQDGA